MSFLPNDNGRFEESDDERTWNGGDELEQDCEKPEASKPEVSADLAILEYVAEFRALIVACGQVSYYYNMKMLVRANVAKAKTVAAAYQHDLRYYTEACEEWRAKAYRSFKVLKMHAEKLGYQMPDNLPNFLNSLALYKKRRECYKYYLDRYLDKNMTFSPAELEEKYFLRLQRRLRREANIREPER